MTVCQAHTAGTETASSVLQTAMIGSVTAGGIIADRTAGTEGDSGVRNMLTYYDKELGRTRVKRRYVWAGWAFAAGAVFGVLIAHL